MMGAGEVRISKLDDLFTSRLSSRRPSYVVVLRGL